MKFNVLVLGEAATGKSGLISKYMDSKTEVKAMDLERDYYWDYQDQPPMQSKEVTFNGKKVNLEINEVIGSRGRMGNHFEVMQAAKNADCVVYCFNPQNQWSFGSLPYTMKTVERGLGLPEQKKKSKGVFKRSKDSSSSSNTEAKKEETKKSIPVVVVQNMSDLGDHADAEAECKKYGYPLVKASALKGEGVENVFQEVLKEVFKSKKIEQSSSSSPASTDANSNSDSTKSPNQPATKEDLPSVWNKLLSKFLKKEKTLQAQQQVEEKGEVAPVA